MQKQQQDQSQIKWISDFIWNIADDRLRDDFIAYQDGFSPNVQEILTKFNFRNTEDVTKEDGNGEEN